MQAIEVLGSIEGKFREQNHASHFAMRSPCHGSFCQSRERLHQLQGICHMGVELHHGTFLLGTLIKLNYKNIVA